MGGKGIFLVANRGLLVYDCWRIVVVPCSLHRRWQLACKDALHTSSQAAKRKEKKTKKTKAAQTTNRQCLSSQRSNFIVREVSTCQQLHFLLQTSGYQRVTVRLQACADECWIINFPAITPKVQQQLISWSGNTHFYRLTGGCLWPLWHHVC